MPALPSSQNFAVFAALTNGRGRVVIDLAIDRLDTLDQIFHRSRTVEFRSPLQEVWILFHVSHGAFPVPGSYQVALRMQGEVIAQRVFEVLTTEN